MKRSLGISGVLVAIAVMLPAVAYGHGGNSDLLHSCVRANGNIRFVAPTGACNANETPRDWPTDTAFTTLQGQVNTHSIEIADLQNRVGTLEANQASISVRVSKAEPQTIQHMAAGGPGAFTAVTFPSARWDTDNMHCAGTPANPCLPPATPSRLTVNTPGTYFIVGNVEWAPNTNGIRLLGIKLDGNINIAQVSQDPVADPTLGSTAQSVSTIWQLNAGQYVELVVRQTSGGPLDIVYNPIYSQEFGMVRMP